MTSPRSQVRGTATCATSSSSRCDSSPNTSVRARSAAVSSPLGIRLIILHGMAVAGPIVTERDVEDAAGLLAGRVRETPLLPAGELSRRVGARTVLKAESLQLTGSFKVRGALNTIAALTPAELEAGVVAASAGNHAQAVAFAARGAGAHATLVMPAGAPLAKVAAVRQYGG